MQFSKITFQVIIKEKEKQILKISIIIFVPATKISKNTANFLNCYFWKWIYILAYQTQYVHMKKLTS